MPQYRSIRTGFKSAKPTLLLNCWLEMSGGYILVAFLYREISADGLDGNISCSFSHKRWGVWAFKTISCNL